MSKERVGVWEFHSRIPCDYAPSALTPFNFKFAHKPVSEVYCMSSRPAAVPAGLHCIGGYS